MCKKIFGILAAVTFVFSLAASVALADWTQPPATPPACPATEPGCNPPLNVGASAQTKTGGLIVKGGVEVGTVNASDKVAAPATAVLPGIGGRMGFIPPMGVPDGRYTYKVTYVTSDGKETDGSPESTIVILPAGNLYRNIIVTALPYSADSRVTSRNIYRKNLDTDNTWKLVMNYPNLVNVTSYTDVAYNAGAAIPTTNGTGGGGLVVDNSLTIKSGSPDVNKVLTALGTSGATAWKSVSEIIPTPSPAGNSYWQLETGKTDTITQTSPITKVHIHAKGATGTSVDDAGFTVVDDTFGNYGAWAINGNGADFYGNNGVYAHSDAPEGVGIATLVYKPNVDLGETYGGKFISPKIGAMTKGPLSLYAQDFNAATVASNSGRDNKVTQSALDWVNGTKTAANPTGTKYQYAGYFDGNVRIKSYVSTDQGTLNVEDPTNYAGAKLGIFGSGGEFYGGQGVYAHSEQPDGIGISTLAQGTGETYGARLIGSDIGTFSRGKVGIYATNNATDRSDGNKIPTKLLNDTNSYAGYFDGNVKVNGTGNPNPIFQAEGTYKNASNQDVPFGGKIGQFGTGAEFYGSSALYVHSEQPGGYGINALASGSGESYGGRLVGIKVGTYNKGNIGLYATDMDHTNPVTYPGARDNLIPTSLLNSSTQYAGYFDGLVQATGDICTKKTGTNICLSTVSGGGASLPTGTNGQTLRNNNGTWVADSNLYNSGTSVGIGTAAPTGALQLNGGNTVSRFNQGTNDTYLTMNDSVGTALLGSTAGLPFVGSQSNTDFTIRTNNSEKVRVTAAGNVGIGVTAPAAKLEVNGKTKTTSLQVGTSATAGQVLTADASGNATWQPVPTPTGGSGGSLSGTANYVAKFTSSSAVGNSQVYDAGTGVGIGTLTPSGKLDVRGFLYVGDPTKVDGDDIVLRSSAANTYSMDNYNGTFRVYTNGDVKFSLDPNGNVMLNGGNPGAGKVLTSIDNHGNASWQAPALPSRNDFSTVTGEGTVSCPAGTVAIGAGFNVHGNADGNAGGYMTPVGDGSTTWTCGWNDGTDRHHCYLRCMKVRD